MKINKAAMVGLGAVGSVYAIHLFDYMKENFAVIAGGHRAERIRKNGQTVNGVTFVPTVIEPENADWKADLILLSMKNYQLEQAICDIRNIITPDTILLPMCNGITAPDILKKAFPSNKVLGGLCRIDTARDQNGIVCSWEGPIQFGDRESSHISEEVQAVQELFDAAGVPHEVMPDIHRAMWLKFMTNVSLNQLSAVTHACYGAFVDIPQLNLAAREVMEEVLAVAEAKGIHITAEDVEDAMKDIASSAHDDKSSMLQDVEAKRKTETDYFAGTMIAEGKAVNVPTPWNDRLYLLIKSIEQLY
ncbi:MAG: ketopantoate reductase family protein [Lachnospiraceae bacterium]|jgi:2-dehydropantoate 2-reductase